MQAFQRLLRSRKFYTLLFVSGLLLSGAGILMQSRSNVAPATSKLSWNDFYVTYDGVQIDLLDPFPDGTDRSEVSRSCGDADVRLLGDLGEGAEISDGAAHLLVGGEQICLKRGVVADVGGLNIRLDEVGQDRAGDYQFVTVTASKGAGWLVYVLQLVGPLFLGAAFVPVIDRLKNRGRDANG